jgi:hypothetical protein
MSPVTATAPRRPRLHGVGLQLGMSRDGRRQVVEGDLLPLDRLLSALSGHPERRPPIRRRERPGAARSGVRTAPGRHPAHRPRPLGRYNRTVQRPRHVRLARLASACRSRESHDRPSGVLPMRLVERSQRRPGEGADRTRGAAPCSLLVPLPLLGSSGFEGRSRLFAPPKAGFGPQSRTTGARRPTRRRTPPARPCSYLYPYSGAPALREEAVFSRLPKPVRALKAGRREHGLQRDVGHRDQGGRTRTASEHGRPRPSPLGGANNAGGVTGPIAASHAAVTAEGIRRGAGCARAATAGPVRRGAGRRRAAARRADRPGPPGGRR